ncbi:hypothetical protein [Mycobacterium marinum]|uniref:hypothetical protein n=1 Tax=Mycobacterium marinum TaxID=1781 RepID=UPI000B9652E2|nr:hypothetical protein [Mycobacterium marinum]
MTNLDKLMATHGSDKASTVTKRWQYPNNYCHTYENIFAPLREKPITLLELGWGEYSPERRDHTDPNNGGASARGWHDYFPNANIIALELEQKNFPDADRYPRITLYDQTNQTDTHALANIHTRHGDFDIIIDDASHISSLTIQSFQTLWPRLKPGGYYCIEDLHTSYHDWYYGPHEADANPDTRQPTAMAFFTRLAHEPFYRGERLHGPKIDGRRTTEWDCYPSQYWLGYRIESISFIAPQLIVIKKAAHE